MGNADREEFLAAFDGDRKVSLAAFAVLGPEDTDKGAVVIDLGEGVTEYIVVNGTTCQHSGQLTVGCEHIVNDLAIGLKLSMKQARAVLHGLGDIGSAVRTNDRRGRIFEVADGGGRSRRIPVSSIEYIIQLRLTELFDHVRRDLEENNAYGRIGGSVRLCGGGALIPGVEQVAHTVLGLPVEIARARAISGQEEILRSPRFMAPIGMIRWGRAKLDQETVPVRKPLVDQLRDDLGYVCGVLKNAFHW